MAHTLEISDELKARIDRYREDDETVEEFLEEMLNIYEVEGIFLQEGYTE